MSFEKSALVDAAFKKALLPAGRGLTGVISIEAGGAEAPGIVRQQSGIFHGEIAQGIDSQFFADFLQGIFGGDEVFFTVHVDAEITGMAEGRAEERM